MRWHACAAALSAAFLLTIAPADVRAQAFPTKPVRVIATSGAGGLSDVFMRVLADELHKKWGQPVVIENRPGGNFNIGTRACAEAEPDGHTICIISNEGVTYNIYMYPNLPFSIEKGIAPITQLFVITQALAVNSDMGVKSVAELVAYAKARPKTLSYSAPAAPLILFLENLNKEQGIDLVRVPFRGGGNTITGVLTGVTPVAFLGIGNMLAHLQSGKMTAILVDSERRSQLAPQVPAIGEIGYTGPITRSYFGLYAPAAVPEALRNRIADDVRAIASQPAFRQKNFIDRGIEPVLSTPQAFAEFLKADRESARRVVEESGMKPH
jgi:tripartite-type tricarboxylate transporter receptor subunit TctC